MTAVTGCRAPRMDVWVGPIRLIALTPVMFDTIVDQSPSPRIYPQLLKSDTTVSFPLKMKAQTIK